MTPTAKLHRSQYDKDQFELVGSTNSFRGEIQSQGRVRGHKVSKTVDGAVRVTTIDDDIRQRAAKHWHAREVKSNCGIGLSGLELGVAGGTAVAGAVVFVVVPFVGSIVGGLLLGVAAIVAVVALVKLGVSIGYKLQAKKECIEWKDPALEIAHHRREAGVRGYDYLKAKRDLRSNAFASGEKTSLALKTMGRYNERCKHINSANDILKAEFVDDFFKSNPLSLANHHDAFGSVDGLETNLKKASSMFKQHAHSYSKIAVEAQNRRNAISNAKDAHLSTAKIRKERLLRRLGQQRQKALKLSRSVHAHPSASRDARMGGVQPGHSASQQMINTTYNELQMQIKANYSGVQRDIVQNAERQTSRVNEWESNRKQLFIPPIRQILETFVQGNDLDENACQIPQQKEVSPPEVNVTYVFPNFDLSDLKEFDKDDLLNLNHTDSGQKGA